MTDASPLRFALVGCGSIADTHARQLAALPEAHLAAVCDTLPERADALAAQFGARALSFADALADPDIDAVTVCVPSGLHAEIGVPALRAGKHVLVEKPMDVSLAACDALLAAQKESGKTLAVVSQHRFDPASLQVRDAINAGDLGPLVMVDARVPWFRSQGYYDSGDWRGTWALDGGGALMNQGVHTVDLMRWLAGPVQSVYAQIGTLAHARMETEDVVCATLTFANGAIGTLTATTAAFPGFPARLALHGTAGSAVIEGDSLSLLAVPGRDALGGQAANLHALQVAAGGTRAATAVVKAGDTAPDTDPTTSVWGDAHRAQFADFIRCCRTGQMPLVDGRAGREAVEVVLAVYQSARAGEVVRLLAP